MGKSNAEVGGSLCIHDVLQEQAKLNPEKVALVGMGRKPIRYSRLLHQVEETVSALNAIGIGLGDRVAVLVPGGPEMAATFLAVSAGGPISPPHPPPSS